MQSGQALGGLLANRGRTESDRFDAVRMCQGGFEGEPAALGDADDRGAIDGEEVEERDEVVDDVGCGEFGRGGGETVAACVEGEAAEAVREFGGLL